MYKSTLIPIFWNSAWKIPSFAMKRAGYPLAKKKKKKKALTSLSFFKVMLHVLLFLHHNDSLTPFALDILLQRLAIATAHSAPFTKIPSDAPAHTHPWLAKVGVGVGCCYLDGGASSATNKEALWVGFVWIWPSSLFPWQPGSSPPGPDVAKYVAGEGRRETEKKHLVRSAASWRHPS